MSAECNTCGSDLVYPAGTWPLGECPVCSVRARVEWLSDGIARIAVTSPPDDFDGDYEDWARNELAALLDGAPFEADDD